MSDQIIQDSVSVADVQPAADSQPNSGTAQLEKNVLELQAQVRALQGDKDRGVKKALAVAEDVSARLAVYESYRSRGLSPDEAQRQMSIDALLAGQAPTVTPVAGVPQVAVPGTPAAQVTAPQVKADEVFGAFGIDPIGPEAMDFYRQGNTSPEALLAFLVSKRQRAPEVSPAQAIAPPGTMSQAGESLQAEFEAKAAALPRGSDQMMKLRQEYRGRGLQI